MNKRVGRYEIQAELGSGGQGQVFRAFDPTVNRMVAIKTLAAGDEPELLTRFRNEAAAAGNLRHPNIVTIYDFGEHQGSPFLVMELLDGETVEHIIANQRPLTLLQKLDIMMQVAAGLHHAHVNTVIHRDVKPANIMVLRDGTVKILDFGIALLTHAAATRVTTQGSLLGTLPYMAPEQFYGTTSDGLTDIFAYGVTFYRLLTGTHPFAAPEMSGLMYNILNKKPPAIRTLTPDCPEALEEAIFKMLAKDRDQRYQSLEDAQFDIEPIIADLQKESIGELLTQAQKLLDSSQLETAQATIRQALAIDPGNRVARDLREQVQKQLREKAVQPRIAALIAEAREQLNVRQFDRAVQKFEMAVSLDKSNPGLRAMVDEARVAWEQAQRADRLTEEVRNALHRGDLTAAHKKVMEAVAADPLHTEAKALLSDVEKEMQTRERERRLRERLDNAKGLLLLQTFEKAIDELHAIQAEFPASVEAGRLLERALKEHETQLRRQRLQAATDEAKELLRNRQFQAALDQMSRAQKEFPESSELRDLVTYAEDELRTQRQTEVIAGTIQEVREMMKVGELDAALDRLRKGLVEYPGAAPLKDLAESIASAKAERQRNEALGDTLKQGVALKIEGRFAEALERVASFVRVYGDSAALDQLRRQAEAGLERQRQVAAARKLILDAHGLIDNGRTATADEVLNEGTIQFPNDPDVVELLDKARSRLREEKLSAAISAVVLEAESLARARQFDRALALLDQNLEQHAGAERLLRCREATVASQLAHERECLRRDGIDQARRFQQQGQLAEALEAIQATLNKIGEDSQVLNLKGEIEKDWARQKAEREAQRRAEAAQNAVQEAQDYLSRNDVFSATRILKKAASEGIVNDQLTNLLGAAEARLLEEKKLFEAISAVVLEATSLARAKQFEPALKLLDQHLGQHPGAERLLRCREATVASQVAHNRECFRRDGIDQARRLQQQGRLADALEAIQATLNRIGEDPQVLDLKVQLEKDWARQKAEVEARQRSEAARSAIQEAEECLNRNDAFSATRILKKAVSDNLADDRVTRLLGTAEARLLEEKQLSAAISAVVLEAESLVQARQFERALTLLDQNLKRYPGTKPLLSCREATVESQIAHEREASRRDGIDQARRFQQQGRLTEALEAIQATLKKVGEDPEVLDLKVRIEKDCARQKAEQEAQRRAEAARNAIQEAQDYLSRDDAVSAIRILHKASSEGLVHDQLTRLLEEAETRLLEERKLSEALSASVREAESLARTKQFERALKLLDLNLERFPGAEPLLRCREETVASQVSHERESVRRDGIDQARRFQQQGRLTEALEVIQTTLNKLGQDPQVLDLKARIEKDWARQQSEQEAQRRAEAARNAVQVEAEGHLSRDDAFSATRILKKAASGGLVNDRLSELLGKAEARLLEKEREQAVAKIEEDVGRLVRTGKYKQALSALADGSKKFPKSDALAQLTQTVLAAKAHAELLEQLHRLTAQGKLESALSRIETALRDTPDDGDLLALKSQIQAQLQSRPREVKPSSIDSPFPSQQQKKQLSWKLAAGMVAVAAILALAIGIALFNPGKDDVIVKNDVILIPIEIRTDPPGASIKLGNQSCVTPNCRLNLAPGQYEVLAEREGFMPATERITVEANKPLSPVSLVLQPIPPDDTVVPSAVAFVVQAGIPNALVTVDNTVRGRTDGAGILKLSLSPKSYSVKVERDGYDVVEKTVRVGTGRGAVTTEVFRLNLKIAKNDGTRKDDTKKDDSKKDDTKKDDAKVDDAKKDDTKKDDTKKDTEPVEDAAAAEETRARNEWANLSNSNDTNALLTFANRYPRTRFADDARLRVAELEWRKVNQQDLAALNAYLARFQNGPHTQEATNLVQNLRKLVVDRQAVSESMAALVKAYNSENIDQVMRVWPSAPRDAFIRVFRDDSDNSMSLSPVSEPLIRQDTATVQYERTTVDKPRRGQQKGGPIETKRVEKVEYVLQRNDRQWVILSFKVVP